MSYKILHVEDQKIFNLPEIKNFLRISHDYDDMWIIELLRCSIEAAENFLRARLLPTRVQVRQVRLYNSEMKLPVLPIAEIAQVMIKTYGAEARQLERFELDEDVLKIYDLSHYEFLIVEYIAGYPNQSKIPAAIKQGILLHTAEMYDSHAATAGISDEVRKLYQPYRRMLV